MKTTVIGLVLILIITFNLYSQGIPYNQEFQINTNQEGYEDLSVTGLQNGGFVTCWQQVHQDSGDFYCQIFDDKCSKIGDELRISKITVNISCPTITGLKKGGFVVCWVSWDYPNNRIFGLIFDNFGFKKCDRFQIYIGSSSVMNLSIAGLSDSSYVACWQQEIFPQDSVSKDSVGIYGQIFNIFGIKHGNQFHVCTYREEWGTGSNFSMAELNNNKFVVCWTSFNLNKNSIDILGQIYDASGSKIGSQFQVNTNSGSDTGFGANPSIIGLHDDGFVVCWSGYPYAARDGQINVQKFNSSGMKIGNEFIVAKDQIYIDNSYPKVAALQNGGFAVCWERINFVNFTSQNIFCKLYNSSGIEIMSEFQISPHLQQNSYSLLPCISGLHKEGFIACWQNWLPKNNEFFIFGKYLLDKPIVHSLKKYSLIEPLNDATLNTNCLAFKWQQPSIIQECYPWEITFDFYIDTNINFSNPQIINNIQDTTYSIDSLAAGKTYFWKVLAKNQVGDSLWSRQRDWGFFIKPGATSVETTEQNLPTGFELFQNYPNPFNSSTEIRYSLPGGKASYQVQLKIYDVLGRLVKGLVDQEQFAASYAISWDGTDLGGNRVSSGVYFYSLEAGDLKSIRKMLVLQ